jgi:predicted nucleic acid-binding protein
MNGRFFLAGNVFVYSLDEQSPGKAEIARRLIRTALDSEKGIVSYQVVQEFFHIALRKFAAPMPIPDCEQYRAITFRPLLAVYFSALLCGEALRIHGQHGVPWFDALILAAALQAERDALYGEDSQHEPTFGKLKIQNPFIGL